MTPVTDIIRTTRPVDHAAHEVDPEDRRANHGRCTSRNGLPAYRTPGSCCKWFAFPLEIPMTGKEKGPNRRRFGPEVESRALSEERCRAGRTAVRRSSSCAGRRCFPGTPLGLAADQSAGSRTGRRRDVAVADVLADRAADDGADRRARDAMLVLGVGRDVRLPRPSTPRAGAAAPCAQRAAPQRGRACSSTRDVRCLCLPRN